LLRSNEGKLADVPTIQDFVESKYIPHIKANKSPSTANGYVNLYRLHIQPRVSGIRLATFETVNGQKLLDQIASDDPEIAHNTLIHIKSLLSGIFSYARRVGDYKGANPIQGRGAIEVEGRRSEATVAYDWPDVETMISTLAEKKYLTEMTAVTVAALSGLSLSELRGLRFADVDDNKIEVKNTYWRKHEGETKTEARTAAVPLLNIVRDAIKAQERRNPGTRYVFEGPQGTPLDLATVGSKRTSPQGQSEMGRLASFQARTRYQSSQPGCAGQNDSSYTQAQRRRCYAKALLVLSPASIAAMKKLAKAVAAQNLTE
jgi:integrase